MAPGSEDARIRGLRPPKAVIDPTAPLAVLREQERTRDGIASVLTVFLAGSECPFTCVFCDLWRHTLDEPTRPGALPQQLENALEQGAGEPGADRIKLYNASNFFDQRAVPKEDHVAIAGLCDPFSRVVVECHPRLVGDECLRFADLLGGRLEVAMGLETVHPEAMPRLNKRMSRGDYDHAAALLADSAIAHRSFVLLGTPFVPADGAVDWTVVSVAYAIDRGAETVTIIPVRIGNGELERLAAVGLFQPPTVSEAEAALERALALPGGAIVQLDLWDFDRLAGCGECRDERRSRLERLNLGGEIDPPVSCAACAGERP